MASFSYIHVIPSINSKDRENNDSQTSGSCRYCHCQHKAVVRDADRSESISVFGTPRHVDRRPTHSIWEPLLVGVGEYIPNEFGTSIILIWSGVRVGSGLCYLRSDGHM